MSHLLKAAILVVSTTVANGSTVDTAGQTLRSVFDQDAGKWTVVDVQTVADDVEQIQEQIRKWTDADADSTTNLVVTTGGTGFAISDQTPEVCMLRERPHLFPIMSAPSSDTVGRLFRR